MLNARLEIGCEEIPARFMPDLLDELKAKTIEKLTSERISFGKVGTFGTYRRLILLIEEISPKQTDIREELQGPPAEVAFDKDNKPTQAAVGFANKHKIKVDALKIKTVGSKNYVSATVTRKGLPTDKILARLFPEIITSLYLPLSMRWGEGDFKFIRPIHWIFASCGGKALNFELAGIKSEKKQKLLKAGIVVDQNKRKELIQKKVKAAAKTALIDEDLLNEVNYLVEDPQVYVGKFDKSFLELPPEILITSMKKNQKFFAVADAEGKLLPRFVVVADGCRNKKIVEGNQKVLTARLSDAKFFFEEDRKASLASRLGELEKVAYFEKLGTVYHKTERMGKLAHWIAKRFGLDEEGLKAIKRIAELAKADLTTKMVYEFPELQGTMGKIYARLSGEDSKVAEGIFEHYLPRFAQDKLPTSLEASAVALADRIDQLVGCFSLGYVPTGSEDPYGLRRAALGVIRILAEKKLDLLFDEAIAESYKLYEPVFLGYLLEKGETGYRDFAKIKSGIIEFAAGRLRPLLLESGIRYDVADAVLAVFNDVADTQRKAAVLNKLVSQPWFAGIVKSQDRIARIAGTPPREQVIEADFAEEEEKKLHQLYLKISWEVGETLPVDCEKALEALAKFTEPLELFFEKVLVLHQDEKIKLNRLALLKSIEKVYLRAADFRKIVLP